MGEAGVSPAETQDRFATPGPCAQDFNDEAEAGRPPDTAQARRHGAQASIGPRLRGPGYHGDVYTRVNQVLATHFNERQAFRLPIRTWPGWAGIPVPRFNVSGRRFACRDPDGESRHRVAPGRFNVSGRRFACRDYSRSHRKPGRCDASMSGRRFACRDTVVGGKAAGPGQASMSGRRFACRDPGP